MILRDIQDASGRRTLLAALTAEGDLRIVGHDTGPGAEEVRGPGNSEYEWGCIIRAAHIPMLLTALGIPGPVLTALGERFSRENAANLGSCLAEHQVPHEVWSRLGD